jgi:hypothetical protein
MALGGELEHGYIHRLGEFGEGEQRSDRRLARELVKVYPDQFAEFGRGSCGKKRN